MSHLPQSPTISISLCERFIPKKADDSYSGNHALEWEPLNYLLLFSMYFELKCCRKQELEAMLWEQGEKTQDRSSGRVLLTLQVFTCSQGAWDWAPAPHKYLSLEKKKFIRERIIPLSVGGKHNEIWTPSISFFCIFFIGVQFANIQYNTQCSSFQVPPSEPVTQSLHPPPTFPSTTLCSFPS